MVKSSEMYMAATAVVIYSFIILRSRKWWWPQMDVAISVWRRRWHCDKDGEGWSFFMEGIEGFGNIIISEPKNLR